jgi:hypothetical protein
VGIQTIGAAGRSNLTVNKYIKAFEKIAGGALAIIAIFHIIAAEDWVTELGKQLVVFFWGIDIERELFY